MLNPLRQDGLHELSVSAIGYPQRAHTDHWLGDHQDLTGGEGVFQRLQGVNCPSQGHLVVVVKRVRVIGGILVEYWVRTRGDGCQSPGHGCQGS